MLRLDVTFLSRIKHKVNSKEYNTGFFLCNFAFAYLWDTGSSFQITGLMDYYQTHAKSCSQDATVVPVLRKITIVEGSVLYFLR